MNGRLKSVQRKPTVHHIVSLRCKHSCGAQGTAIPQLVQSPSYSGLCHRGKSGKVARFLMRRITILKLIPAMFVVLGVAAGAAESDTKLERFFKRYLEESFQL